MSLQMIIAVLSTSGSISGTVGSLINAVSIDDYGAVGDGSTDDTAALAAAIADISAGMSVIIPRNKTYKIVGVTGGGSLFAAVELTAGKYIIGEDRHTSKIKVTGNGRGIQMMQNTGVFNLTMIGGGISSGHNFNAGLVPFHVGVNIVNCDFTDFAGDDTTNGGGGIYPLFNSGIAGDPDFKDGYTITGCDFYNNVTGLNMRARVEYVTVKGGRFLRNTTGLSMIGGNNVFEGLNLMANTKGIKIDTGTNDGHGTFANCRANHNTTNLEVLGIVNGITFTGCHFYEGDINIDTATGVKFIGCDLVGAGDMTVDTSTVIILGCRYPVSPTSTALNLINTSSTITTSTNFNF